MTSSSIHLQGQDVDSRKSNDCIQQPLRSFRVSKSHRRNVGSPNIHIAGRDISQPIRRNMEIGVQQLLILPIVIGIIGQHRRQALVNAGRQIHVVEGINKRGPYYFLQQFDGEMGLEGGKIFECLDGIEHLGRDKSSTFDISGQMPGNDNLGKPPCLLDHLEQSAPSLFVRRSHLGFLSLSPFAMPFSAPRHGLILLLTLPY